MQNPSVWRGEFRENISVPVSLLSTNGASQNPIPRRAGFSTSMARRTFVGKPPSKEGQFREYLPVFLTVFTVTRSQNRVTKDAQSISSKIAPPRFFATAAKVANRGSPERPRATQR